MTETRDVEQPDDRGAVRPEDLGAVVHGHEQALSLTTPEDVHVEGEQIRGLFHVGVDQSQRQFVAVSHDDSCWLLLLLLLLLFLYYERSWALNQIILFGFDYKFHVVQKWNL